MKKYEKEALRLSPEKFQDGKDYTRFNQKQYHEAAATRRISTILRTYKKDDERSSLCATEIQLYSSFYSFLGLRMVKKETNKRPTLIIPSMLIRTYTHVNGVNFIHNEPKVSRAET